MSFHDDKDKAKTQGCCSDEGCGCSDDACGCDDEGCDCGHDHGHEGHDHEHARIVMTDTETGKEYAFQVEDMFDFEDNRYFVLVTEDSEEPELVITKVIEMEDGSEGLVSLDEDESERVYAEYDRLCDEAEEDDGDDEDGQDPQA